MIMLCILVLWFLYGFGWFGGDFWFGVIVGFGGFCWSMLMCFFNGWL